MKKLLALVLALVMTLGLATVGANAFTDQTDVDASNFEEAIAVLNGIEVFQGDPNGNFNPTKNITRAEVAAIIYRITTTDVEGPGKDKSNLYVGYGNFSDVADTAWYAGYVGYCANAGYIKGKSATIFDPQANVTGYEALAMILRAVGYDKMNEFTGENWKFNVASRAQELKILSNVKEGVLSAAAARELVAELLFQTITKVPQVTYSPALLYSDSHTTVTNNVVAMAKNDTLGWQNFRLAYDDQSFEKDDWGRPASVWFKENNKTITKAEDATYDKGTDTQYALRKDTPIYTTEAKEVLNCDVYDAIDTGTIAAGQRYINGVNGTPITFLDNDRTFADSGFGRTVEFYKVVTNRVTGATAIREVVIDTYLAQVTDVVTLQKDRNDHVTRPARIDLEVFNGHDAIERSIYMTSTSADYPYAQGDYVLVNVNEADQTLTNVVYGVPGALTAANNKSEIEGAAPTTTGKQTYIWYSQNKHTIEGEQINDSYQYANPDKDEAGIDSTNAYTWFYDNHGYVIGSAKIEANKSYAILTALQWIHPQLEYGYAIGTLMYMDGTTETKTIYAIDKDKNGQLAADNLEVLQYNGRVPSTTDAFDLNTLKVSDNLIYNRDYFGTDLWEVQTNANGSVNLLHPQNTYEVETAEITDQAASPNALSRIHKGTSYVTGYDTADNQQTIYTNSNTVYIYASLNADGKTYTYSAPITGFQNVPSFETNPGKVIDYVLDTNRWSTTHYAKYVYIVGTPDTAATAARSDVIQFASNTIGRDLGQQTTPFGSRYTYALLNVVHADGSTAPLYLTSSNNIWPQIRAFATDAQGQAFVVNNIVLSNDVEYVDVSDGDFKNFAQLKDDTGVAERNTHVGSTTTYQGTYEGPSANMQIRGNVLAINALGKHYNVIDSTVIVTKDGQVLQGVAGLTEEVIKGTSTNPNYIYVVQTTADAKVGNDIAAAIFVSGVPMYNVESVKSSEELAEEVESLVADAEEAIADAAAVQADSDATADEVAAAAAAALKAESEAAKAYAALTDEQKALVDENDADKISGYEDDLKDNWNTVSAAYQADPDTTTEDELDEAWDLLTDEQKAAEEDADPATDIETVKAAVAVDALAAELDTAKGNLSGLNAAGNLDDATQMYEAMTAYNALETSAEKAAVLGKTSSSVTADDITAMQNALNTYWTTWYTAIDDTFDNDDTAKVWSYTDAATKTAQNSDDTGIDGAYVKRDKAFVAAEILKVDYSVTVAAGGVLATNQANIKAALKSEVEKTVKDLVADADNGIKSTVEVKAIDIAGAEDGNLGTLTAGAAVTVTDKDNYTITLTTASEVEKEASNDKNDVVGKSIAVVVAYDKAALDAALKAILDTLEGLKDANGLFISDTDPTSLTDGTDMFTTRSGYQSYLETELDAVDTAGEEVTVTVTVTQPDNGWTAGQETTVTIDAKTASGIEATTVTKTVGLKPGA